MGFKWIKYTDTNGKNHLISERSYDILQLLANNELTTSQIIKKLYPDKKVYTHNGKVKRQSTTYNSVVRTLRLLQRRGLVNKVVARTLWAKVK